MHITRGGAVKCLNEIGVLRRDFGSSDAQPFQARGLNQASSVIARRVSKDAAGVSTTRLVLATPRDNLRHLRTQFVG